MQEPHRSRRYLIASLTLLLLVAGLGYLQVTRNVLTSCDLYVFRLIGPLQGNALNTFMQIVTRLGEEEFLTPIIACIYWTGYPVESIVLAAMLLFGGSLNNHFKNLFSLHRPLPSETQILSGASGYGYPSGHTESATALSAFTYVRVRKYLPLCLLPAILVGSSRIFLGVHYFSDVIGGLAVGTAVVLVGFAAYQTLHQWTGLRQILEHSLSLKLLLSLLLPASYILIAWGTEIAPRGAGSLAGLLVGYHLAPYRWRRKSWIGLIAVWVLGLTILFLIRTGLKAFLPETAAFAFLRYLVVGLCMALCPVAFAKVGLLTATEKVGSNR